MVAWFLPAGEDRGSVWFLPAGEEGGLFWFLPNAGEGGRSGYSPLGERVMFFPLGRDNGLPAGVVGFMVTPC